MGAELLPDEVPGDVPVLPETAAGALSFALGFGLEPELHEAAPRAVMARMAAVARIRSIRLLLLSRVDRGRGARVPLEPFPGGLDANHPPPVTRPGYEVNRPPDPDEGFCRQ